MAGGSGTKASCDSHAVSQWLERGLGAQSLGPETRQSRYTGFLPRSRLFCFQRKPEPSHTSKLFRSFYGLEVENGTCKNAECPLHPCRPLKAAGDRPCSGDSPGKSKPCLSLAVPETPQVAGGVAPDPAFLTPWSTQRPPTPPGSCILSKSPA